VKKIINNNILTTLMTSGAMLAVGFSQNAIAAEQSGASSNDHSDAAIIVTARKRQETILDVPIAISAFNSASMQDRLVQDVSDIADFTPGFQINESFGRDSDRPVMRGASNILFSDGKVGVFVDGIPYFGDFSSLDVDNAARVEVIKGPQSAVFGRGTLSGAINVIMKRPTNEIEGRVSATYGNYNRTEFSGSLSGPIANGIGFQIGGKYFDIDGQYKNLAVPGERLGDQNTKQLTGALFFDPTPDISASVRWFHQEDDDGHFAIALQPSTFNNCFQSTRSYYCGTVKAPTEFAINTDRLTRPGLARNADRFLGDLAWDIAGSGYEASFQVGYSDVKEVIGVDQTYDGRFYEFLPRDLCGTGFYALSNQDCSKSSFEPTNGTHRKTQTYEWRLSSPSEDRLRWRVGLFHSADTLHGLTEYLELNEVGPEVLDDTRKVKNMAYFGGLDFDVTSAITVSAELRHQIDKVRSITPTYRVGDVFSDAYLNTVIFPNQNAIVGTAANRSATFKATLPRFMVNWKLDRSTSLYAQYSQGNSPGGFNKITAPNPVYYEEQLINYEVGIKTTRLGFDYLNISAFWQSYNKQVLTNTFVANNTVDSYSVNIGKTRIRGLELDGQLPLVGKILKLQFNYSYLDADILRGIDSEKAIQLLGRGCKPASSINLDLPGCRDAASIAGNTPPLVSKHTGSAGLRFRHEAGNGWEIFSGADLIYRSSWYDQVLNLARSGASTKVNLQLGAENDKGMRVAIFARNIFGDETPTGILRYLDVPAPRTPTGDYARGFGVSPARKPEFGLTVSQTF
jgi:iron complex outermembrane receptor protein